MVRTILKSWLLIQLGTIVSVFTLFAATPEILNVNGEVTNASILTINGQYLLDENRTNWMPMFQSGTAYGFEGSSHEADGYDHAPDEMVYGVSDYDSTVYLTGNKSFRGRVTGGSGKRGAGLYIPVSGSDFYVRFYTRWHSAGAISRWPDNYIKMLTTMGPTDQLYLQPNATSGSSLPTEMNMQYNSTPHIYSISDFMEDNRWYCIEARFKTSSPTNFTVWVNGVQVASVNGHSSVGLQQFIQFGMINMCCTGNDFDLTEWIDNFVVSTTRVYPSTVIQVGNSPDYTTAVKVNQEPIYLSDGSIRVKLNLVGLGSGPYYLWVTNNRLERSATHSLSGSYEVDVMPPSTSIVSPTGGSLVGSQTIVADATDNVGVADVQFKLNGADLGTKVVSRPYSLSWDTTSVSNGTHSLSVVARDTAGNQATSSPIVVNVSNSEPAALFKEGFDDNNFSSRGWFDDTSVSLDTNVKYAGASSLKLTWAQGATAPAGIGAMRKSFTETESLYVSMYWRFNSDWVGSAVGYHPHLVMIPSSLDDPWGGLAYNYLDTYIETSNLNPRLIIQDGMNASLAYGSIPNNLTNITENRDVAGCNGCLTGSDCGSSSACYDAGNGSYWNGRFWNGSSNFALSKWHKVEVYFKMNSISGSRALPDGIMRMKVDGNYVIDKSNVVFRTNQHPTMKWKTMVIAPWIGDGSPKAQTMWIDELAVGNSAIGEMIPPSNLQMGVQ